MVEVDETAEAEFADPPRTWSRVGALAAGWAIVLVLGGWIAPGFAASSSDEDVDPRDEDATDAIGAAWSYLRYGSSEDLDRADASLCDGASPELTPAGLDAIRQSYADALGGVTRVDVATEDPVSAADGLVIAATVSYVSQGTQRHEEFVVTVQQTGDFFCVSNAVRVQEEEPSQNETSGEEVDPQALATDFLRMIVVERNPTAAAALECSPAAAYGAQDLDAAIAVWEEGNTTAEGTANGFINSLTPAEGSVTAFTAEIVLRGDLANETFTFDIGVQGDCVSSITTETGFPDGSGG